MEYQEIINSLDVASNQPSKFSIKNWVEINDDSYGRYETGSQIRFGTSMIRSSLCDYKYAYIHVKATFKNPEHSSHRCSHK